MSAQYYIIYHAGFRSHLEVIEVLDSLKHELEYYDVASPDSWPTREAAEVEAKLMAVAQGATFIPYRLLNVYDR